MDPIEAGLVFALKMIDGDTGAVLLGAGERLDVRAERMWAPPLLAVSRDLWARALAGARGVLLSPPVIAFPAITEGRLAGLLCVAVPPHGRPAAMQDMETFAQFLVRQAVDNPAPLPAAGLAMIHLAADPAAALVKLLERHRWNVSSLADELQCTRKAIYAAARRYNVRLVARRQ